MLRSRLLWKIYTVFAVAILLSAVIVGSLVIKHLKHDTHSDIQNSLQAQAALLAELATPYFGKFSDKRLLQQKVHALGGEIGTRLTVISPDGIVLADSEKNPQAMDNHGSRPEIMESRYHACGVALRLSDTLKTQMMYLARAVYANQELLGYVRSSLPLATINQQLARIRWLVASSIGLITVTALLLGFFLARHFIRPLTRMTEMAEAMAEGNFDGKLKIQRKDEVGRLAQSLNRMAVNSRQRLETINTDRHKLNAILASMTEGVVAVNQDKQIIHINDAAARLLAVDPATCFGRSIWEVSRRQPLCDILASDSTTLQETKTSMKISYGTRNQEIEIHAAPLKDGSGQPVGAMAVLHDVSELRHLETVRRDFVVNASHELKTPITAIRGLVETILDDFDHMSPEQQLLFLQKIRNQSVRLSAIVVDLMALSRFETRDDLMLTIPLDLADIATQAIKSLTPSAEEKELQLDLELAEIPLEFIGDEDAITQAVTNLLDNAIKYTPPHGHVWVRLRTFGNEAIIEVADNGIGIEPKDQQRIFERFYRVDKARSRELGGTGLGLAIVRHIAMVYRGRVEVESVPGRGSTFRLILPLAPENTGQK
ncbi:MAG: HAMP domain-containing protein [Deltaproteobacteria bacterium]|nr:HAMP domain-containing protein [Candidatus Anaeroferrophillus wilburensis]MBN2887886.1 HAMP domain-containing protein [Deltaproteobacteria bacterium]